MTRAERANWICNIENLAASVEEELGKVTVQFILEEKGGGASSIETIEPVYLNPVYNELFDYAAGLKD